MLGKWIDKLQNIINTMTGLMLIVMVIITFCQVIMRYILGRSLSWSEELNRYMFIWMIYMGVNLGIKAEIQIKIDVVETLLKGNAIKFIKIIQHVITLTAIALAAYGSFTLIRVGFLATSPSLHLPMWIMYLTFPIGFFLDFIEVIRRLWIEITQERGIKA